MRAWIIFGIGTLLVLSGCLGLPPGTEGTTGEGNTATLNSNIICELDEECADAVNAFYTPYCNSPNCPPEEQTQPAPNAEGFEWVDSFTEGCINSAKVSGKDALGEELQINPRASCACQPLENTSIKTCQSV
mgnify:CR=1 FL=1